MPRLPDRWASTAIALAGCAVLAVAVGRLWPEVIADSVGVSGGGPLGEEGSMLMTGRLVTALFGAVCSTIMVFVLTLDADRLPATQWPTGWDATLGPLGIGFVHALGGLFVPLYVVSCAGLVWYLSRRGTPVDQLSTAAGAPES